MVKVILINKVLIANYNRLNEVRLFPILI